MSPDEGARRLLQYIQSLTNFVYHKCDPPYGHMGATIADTVLQANMKDASLQKVRAIHGVGPKTVDYLKIMAGLQSIAIDRRLMTFLGNAGIPINPSAYSTAREILRRAALLLSVPEADFDHSIWRYMGGEDIAPCA